MTLRILLLSAALACALAVGCEGPRAPVKPSLGTLKHRQTRHQLRDLLDPAYRARCADPAIKKMKPESSLAGQLWAGE